MSSLQSLRELISERLAAAAEEICRLCEGTIVQYEQELCRQRRLLDVIWKPQLQLHHIALPQHWKTEEEDLCNQQRNFRVEQEEPEPPQIQEEPEHPQIQEEQEEQEPPQIQEEQEEPEPPQIQEEQEEPEPPQIQEEQEEPEPPQIKEEQEPPQIQGEPEPPQIKEELQEPEPPQIKEELQEPEPPQIKEEPEELCISQEDQLDLKQETETLMEIPAYEEDENSEADLNNQQNFNVTDSQDEEGNQHEESTSTTDEETDPQSRDQRKRRDRSHVQSVDSSHMSAIEKEQSYEKEEEKEPDGSLDPEDVEGCDDGISLEVDASDSLHPEHSEMTSDERVMEEVSPVQQDVLMGFSELHPPGFEEVESLATALLLLVDDSDRHIIPADIRQRINTAAVQLQNQYESKTGCTLFARCLGPAKAENIAAQKTQFARLTHAQAAQTTGDSRLLYLLIKMLKNRPPASQTHSPTKINLIVRAQYKRIVDRIRDDPVLSALHIPLPNIDSKSISAFLTCEEQKANYRATMVPQVTCHQRVLSAEPMSATPHLPDSLPAPNRLEVQYPVIPELTDKRWAEKRRLEVTEPTATCRKVMPKVSPTASQSTANAPILLVVPSQPQAPSMSFPFAASGSGAGFSFTLSPACVPARPFMPPKSHKPCAACGISRCGGLRKRYTPSKERVANSKQKIFTYCPTTKKSTTPGFYETYTDYEDFKKNVDLFLAEKDHSMYDCECIVAKNEPDC
ncbi:uncharacterized protein LOC144987029 isoform X2 [Oryzias latipes]